ncbi:tetratricopeptide repeat protein [Nocardioides donggukensis]|uniref:Tetratricopeptide repeat protein n=1 Tax=Nocardioides donggukensis TaxID=2774019 RepID=A0A927Q2S3_9ACTN|nr:tetratricopeptide repeat protein [Nocardioides donggukensis]MBD8869926.1 tetratricopeptide repeat protein [Nocardioides donggukensis]
MDDGDDFSELPTPAVLFPGPVGHPSEAFQRAWELLEQRAPREALAVLEPAVEAEPQARSLRSLRAWAYFMRVQLTRAEADLRVIVEEDPSDVWARHTLGRALERQSRFDEALPHLRLAAAMSGDPEHEAAVLRVERRLAETGQTSFDDLT